MIPGGFLQISGGFLEIKHIESCLKIKNRFFSNFQVYILNKAQIDPVLDKVKAQFDEISGKVFAMIPQAKPAEKIE